MSRPVHSPEVLNAFPVRGDELLVGGVPVTLLAERAGQTPFYAYDRQKISARVDYLRRQLPASIHLHYAVKANPMPALVQHMATLVDGFDLASGGEMRVALDTPMPPEHISFAGPGKRRPEIAGAIASGVTLNIESMTELGMVVEEGERLGIQPRIMVRINPDFELKASGMKMGGGAKQFGVDAERVPGMLEQIGNLDCRFQGFHIYSGSQNLRPQAIIEAQEKTFELAYRMADYAPARVEKLNIGGGFGIPYFPGDVPLDLAPVGERLHELMQLKESRLPDAAVIIELGRYLAGEAGVYVCRVLDRKISRDQVFLVTDGGMHHHLAASGNFGQFVRKNYPVLIGTRMAATEKESGSVTGPLCTPLDLLADKLELARADVGDLVVVLQSGAYGCTASPMLFLSHPPPVELFV